MEIEKGEGAAAWERFVFFSPLLTLSPVPKEVSLLTSAATFLTACQLSVTIQFKQWSLTQTPPPVLRSSLATEGGRTHRMRNIRSEQQLTKRRVNDLLLNCLFCLLLCDLCVRFRLHRYNLDVLLLRLVRRSLHGNPGRFPGG